jgi:hypothetical protein
VDGKTDPVVASLGGADLRRRDEHDALRGIAGR